MNKKKIDELLKVEIDNEKIKKVILYLRIIFYTFFNINTEFLYI